MFANSITLQVQKELTKLSKKPNNMFKLVKLMKKGGKDIEGGRRMKGKTEVWF